MKKQQWTKTKTTEKKGEVNVCKNEKSKEMEEEKECLNSVKRRKGWR